MTAATPKAQAPLKINPAEAVWAYLATGMREAMHVLDGTTRSQLLLLTNISPERIDELGGVRE